MGRLKPKPYKNESTADYRKRLVEIRNNNPIVKIGLLKKQQL